MIYRNSPQNSSLESPVAVIPKVDPLAAGKQLQDAVKRGRFRARICCGPRVWWCVPVHHIIEGLGVGGWPRTSLKLRPQELPHFLERQYILGEPGVDGRTRHPRELGALRALNQADSPGPLALGKSRGSVVAAPAEHHPDGALPLMLGQPLKECVDRFSGGSHLIARARRDGIMRLQLKRGTRREHIDMIRA